MSDNDLFDAAPLPPLEIAEILDRGGEGLDRYLGARIYANTDPSYIERQRRRLSETAKQHARRVGDRPTYLLRAPGRLNAFLEYLDMCAGDHMSTTIDGDIPVAISPRNDGVIDVANCDSTFAPSRLRIRREMDRFRNAPMDTEDVAHLEDNWDNRTRVHPHYKRRPGDWMNYILCAFLRVGWELPEVELRGADMTFGPSAIPMRAGLSSSSALVVLSYLALALANRGRIPDWDVRHVCKLLGEAEWYVGTHGGANDHTTILRNLPNGVLYNRHSMAKLDCAPLPCLRGVRVVIANSLWEANKALGARHNFNLRKGWMDLGNDLMVEVISAVCRYLATVSNRPPRWLSTLLLREFRYSPGIPPRILESGTELWRTIAGRYKRFGSLHEDLLGIPDEAITELIGLLPEEIATATACRILGKDLPAMARDYTLPEAHEGGYRTRAAARFFYKENKIGRALERIFLEAYSRLADGEITADSDEYDRYRIEVGGLLDDLQETLREDFQVSNVQLELLLEIARGGPGYLGGKLTGAGSGGCASILVREGSEDAFCEYLDREYYAKPANFQSYREALDDLQRISAADSWKYAEAIEMKRNLEQALAHIPDQHGPVTFSRGACVVRLNH